MCIDRTHTKAEKKEVLDQYEGDWVQLTKLVQMKDEQYYPQYHDTIPFKAGLNSVRSFWDNFFRRSPVYIVIDTDEKYQEGYHFYIKDHGSNYRCLDAWQLYIKCYTKKSWITNTGFQYHDTVVIATKDIFPTFPNTDLTQEELKKWGINKALPSAMIRE